MKRSKPYKEYLNKHLADPENALGYLQECLKDPDRRVFLLALRDVAEAQGGLTRLARLAKLSREHLYDMLSKNGNPEFSGLEDLLEALGFRLSVEQKNSKRFKKAA